MYVMYNNIFLQLKCQVQGPVPLPFSAKVFLQPHLVSPAAVGKCPHQLDWEHNLEVWIHGVCFPLLSRWVQMVVEDPCSHLRVLNIMWSPLSAELLVRTLQFLRLTGTSWTSTFLSVIAKKRCHQGPAGWSDPCTSPPWSPAADLHDARSFTASLAMLSDTPISFFVLNLGLFLMSLCSSTRNLLSLFLLLPPLPFFLATPSSRLSLFSWGQDNSKGEGHTLGLLASLVGLSETLRGVFNEAQSHGPWRRKRNVDRTACHSPPVLTMRIDVSKFLIAIGQIITELEGRKNVRTLKFTLAHSSMCVQVQQVINRQDMCEIMHSQTWNFSFAFVKKTYSCGNIVLKQKKAHDTDSFVSTKSFEALSSVKALVGV